MNEILGGLEAQPKVFRVGEIAGREVLEPLKLTSEYSLECRPWLVTLEVRPAKHAHCVYQAMYVVRHGNPGDAVAKANAFWTEWEKNRFAPRKPYPDTEGRMYAECIDEGDYFKLLKVAQKAGIFLYFGPRVNPAVFTWYDKAWPAVWKPYLKAAKSLNPNIRV